MSHPVLWSKRIYFYPIGNTSAVCLTQDLPPEEPANVLLLGCGDPRNILYTVYASNKASDKSACRQMDFTCCDFEPGVLARNIILLTLVVDGCSSDSIWNIFFHFKLDVDSLSLLVSQSKRLVEMSKDIETWNASPYSTFIRMCSEDTLARLHQYWSRYTSFYNLPDSRIKSILRHFSSVQKDNDTLNFSTARSAGLFLVKAVEKASPHFNHYWKTGIVYRDHRRIAAASKLNPTFVYSVTGEGCAVHYGTHPLQCFHLGEAFASSRKLVDVEERELVAIACSQFDRWCAAFKGAISTGCVRIRLFAGDAVAFCHALHRIRITSSPESGVYTSAWSGSVLTLDSSEYTTGLSAPTTFNVVDSSNIIDHIGLLNLLISVVPLLQHSAFTTLYTEALLVHGEKAETGFLERLCTDIPVMALLLGVCPAGCVSTFCSQSNVHEILMQHFIKSKQYHERIAWKIPYLSNGDAVSILKLNTHSPCPSFQPQTLAALLFNIYYNMFKSLEDLTLAQQRMMAMFRNVNLESGRVDVKLDSFVHYHRATFASFLGLVKSRVDVDWNATMEQLNDLLVSDRSLLLGSNFYQELFCLLHMRGVYSTDILRINSEDTTSIDRTGIFSGWSFVPSVVCVVLLVPRSNIKVLEDAEPDKIGSPVFHGQILSNFYGFHNIFGSIQINFGNVRAEGSGSDTKVIIDEDPSGLGGRSPLVVSFWVPAFNLARERPSLIEVSLGVHSTPGAAMSLTKYFGLRLQVFTANLTDRKHVHIVSARPHYSNELDVLRAIAPQPPPLKTQPVSVSKNSSNQLDMTVRWDLTPGPDREALSKPTTQVSFRQVAPCVISVLIGTNAAQHSVVFPFPVIGEKIKLRIARKSGYIEVVGPVRWPVPASMGTNFATQASTMFLSERNIPLLWNIHRVDLQYLPLMDGLDSNEVSTYVNPHVSLAFSDYEAELRKNGSESDALMNVKDSLHALFNRALESNARRIFGLRTNSDGVYTIIFLNAIRLDVASHTLVADGCVLPLTDALVEQYIQVLGQLASNGQMVEIVTTEREVVAWKHLLPAFTERCRTGWSHKKTCEYIKAGVPRGEKCSDNPICSCGEGMNLGKITEKKEWTRISGFMTRIAISPLFAISYLHAVGNRGPATSDSEISSLHSVGNRGPATREEQSKVCALPSCKKPGSKTCARCKTVKYCSAECQRAHWKVHKMFCNA